MCVRVFTNTETPVAHRVTQNSRVTQTPKSMSQASIVCVCVCNCMCVCVCACVCLFTNTETYVASKTLNYMSQRYYLFFIVNFYMSLQQVFFPLYKSFLLIFSQVYSSLRHIDTISFLQSTSTCLFNRSLFPYTSHFPHIQSRAHISVSLESISSLHIYIPFLQSPSIGLFYRSLFPYASLFSNIQSKALKSMSQKSISRLHIHMTPVQLTASGLFSPYTGLFSYIQSKALKSMPQKSISRLHIYTSLYW